MTLLLEQFVVPLKQPLPYRFSLENTLVEYLFPDARFAIGWFDPSLSYDSSPIQSMNLQCLDGDRGYYSDEPIRERLHLNTGADFLASNSLFRSCQTVVQEHTVRLKVVEEGAVQMADHSIFIGVSCGKISASLAQALTRSSSIAFQVGFGVKPQNGHAEYRFAIATVTPNSDIAPYDLILPRSCFRGEALAVGDYELTIGFGVFELAVVQDYSLGTTVLVNYPITVETEFLPRLRVQAEKLAQLQHDPRHFAQQYLYQRQLSAEGCLPSLTIEESNWFDQFLQTDLDHHFQLLEHPYIAARLIEFSQLYWSAISTGKTLKAQTAIVQPDLNLQPDQVSVSELPDGAEVIVLKLPFITSNDAWVMRNHQLPGRTIRNCVYLHPDTAAALQIGFGGERLAFLPAIEHPTFAAEIADLQYPHNRYPAFDQSRTVNRFEQFVSAYQPTLIETVRRQVQYAIALLTEMQRLTPEQRFSYLQDVIGYFQQLDQPLEPLDPEIVAIQTQVRSLCSEFDLLDVTDVTLQPALMQPLFNQLRQILKVVIGYLASFLRVVEKGEMGLSQSEIDFCCAVSSYKPVAWLDILPTDLYLSRPMPSGDLGAIDALIQQTNGIWATAPPLRMRPLIQFNPLFLPEPSGDSTLSTHFSNYEQIARALYDLRSASLTNPAIEAYQTELGIAVETLSELWSEPSLMAAHLWQWFHRRKRSDLTLQLDAEEMELAKLIFLSFPQHILNQLKALQFTRLKVTGLQYFTNKHLGRNWGSQSVAIALSRNSIANSPDFGKPVILVENELLGRLTAQSPRLPIGTTAIATIHPLPNSIAVATTTDGIPLRIRSHAAQFPKPESLISLEIVSQPSEQNPSKLLWYAKIDGETIGLLCHRSVGVLKTLRRLHTGTVFQVNLHPLLPETAWVELEPSSVRYPQIWQHAARLN
ncbi:hypothetical protein [Leptolyngbya sp. NIES-2104]|uniref:hypothetical protein n=1 Tax=Leptolyngbya sp. NIES-2104 TaxID=1552121 RepID=UPI0006ECA1AE|nr:hypothetical protein [Leptolyngbya sp. NIES-2104]GAP99586.1 hypothetical protein NIES2104_61520 [Leptolyngbya sp. NIES-2104]